MNSGQLVLVTLQNPREKFWGMLLALTPAGASLRGVDLQSFDDFIADGEGRRGHRGQHGFLSHASRTEDGSGCTQRRIAVAGRSVCGEDRI